MSHRASSATRQVAWTRARRVATLLALLTVPLAVAGSGAMADDPIPKPSSCHGFEDPPGDQAIEGLIDAPVNTDITGVFFRYAKDSSGAYVLTANIRIKNLDKTPFEGGGPIVWNVVYSNSAAAENDPERYRVAGAQLDSEGNVTFFENSFDLTAAPAPEETDGRLYEGADGVIEIDIPATRGLADKTLTEVYAETVVLPTPTAQYLVGKRVDRAPDGADAFGSDFKVAPCVADEAEPTPTPTATATATATADPDPTPTADPDPTPTAEPDPTPTADPAPDPTPTPTQESTPAPGEATSPPVNPPGLEGLAGKSHPLQLTVRPRTLRANRARRGKPLRLALSTREPLRKLTAVLTKRSRVVGRARLARLSRKGILRLKLGRTIRKGTYALTLTATRANGTRGKLTVKIVVR